MLPRWFLILGLGLGVPYALFMGPWHVMDEEQHMYRSYLVSQGICTGQAAIGGSQNYDLVLGDFRKTYRRFNWVRLPPTTTARDMAGMVGGAIPSPLIVHMTAVNLYSCLVYLPSAAAVRLGRSFFGAGSPFLLLYIGRLGNLVCYLLTVIAAMRILPELRLPLAVLALMPMALSQAASVSADAVTFALSFILTAYILRLSLTADPVPIRRSNYFLLAAGVVAAGLSKANAGLALLVLLIPGARFPNRRTRWLAAVGYVALAYGTAAVWQYVNHPNGEIFVAVRAAALGMRPDENAAFILQHPLVFVSTVGHTIKVLGWEYIGQFVGKLGRLEIPLPDGIPGLYVLLLGATAAVSRVHGQLSRGQRILLAGIFLFNAGCMFATVWITDMPHALIASNIDAGRGHIAGVYGRYFIPFAFLPMAAVSGTIGQARRWFPVAALTVVAAVNLIALQGVWDKFQSHSSTIPNRIRLMAQLRFSQTPQTAVLLYNNLVVSSETSEQVQAFLVSGGVKHQVPNSNAITHRGYKWPEDVVMVSDKELADIPDGAPLTAPTLYEGQLLRRPGSTAEDSKIYVVLGDQKHWVWDGRWITSHGYKDENIRVIPAEELAEIPEGSALP